MEVQRCRDTEGQIRMQRCADMDVLSSGRCRCTMCIDRDWWLVVQRYRGTEVQRCKGGAEQVQRCCRVLQGAAEVLQS